MADAPDIAKLQKAQDDAWAIYRDKRPHGDIDCEKAFRAGWAAASIAAAFREITNG